MASLIKNQILKHLSKFTKNLSADKINLSTFKGEGELSNLELNENVLMELMDLPTWLKLSKAVCNRVSIRIHWTKLKSQPICIYLDEVVVEMETCDEPRKPQNLDGMPSYSSGGKYGFLDKVVDGMFVLVNSVVVNFKAHAFHGSIQMSRIKVESKSPLWRQINDIRQGRIKDQERGFLLLFKEIEWQTLRIEASALTSHDPDLASTPLRLITNKSKIRIVVKKTLSDCSIVSSKVQLVLDDLLWVLTDSQLKAVILYAKSLKEVLQKSADQSKESALEKLQKQGHIQGSKEENIRLQQQHQYQQEKHSSKHIEFRKFFDKYDVVETSYHIFLGRIDLHLCNEFSNSNEASSSPGQNGNLDGGAMQITLHRISLDHYPFHPSSNERKHFVRFNEEVQARNEWAKELLQRFKEELSEITKQSPPVSPFHLASSPKTSQTQRNQDQYQSPKGQGQKVPAQKVQSVSKVQSHKPAKLLESCFIFRMEDFTLYKVSTSSDNKKAGPKKFFCSDKKSLHLPPEMSSVHVEHTSYYFPQGVEYPVPSSNLFVKVTPFQLILDYRTILWMNSFMLSLAHTADIEIEDGPKEHVDIRIDSLMPKLILHAEKMVDDQPERPDSLHIQASKMIITNVVDNEKATLSHLDKLVKRQASAKLHRSTGFPNMEEDLDSLPDIYARHVSKQHSVYLNPLPFVNGVGVDGKLGLRSEMSTGEPPQKAIPYQQLGTHALKHDATKDVWCAVIEQLWLDFGGVQGSKNRPVPFVESFPLTLWIALPQLSNGTESISDRDTNSLDDKDNPVLQNGHESMSPEKKEKLGDVNIIVDTVDKVCAQLNHYQFLFLMRLIESVTELQKKLEADTVSIMQKEMQIKKICVGLVLPELELALVCPPVRTLVPNISREGTDSEDLGDRMAKQEGSEESTGSPRSSVPTNSEEQGDSTQHSPDGAVLRSHSDTDILETAKVKNPGEQWSDSKDATNSERIGSETDVEMVLQLKQDGSITMGETQLEGSKSISQNTLDGHGIERVHSDTDMVGKHRQHMSKSLTDKYPSLPKLSERSKRPSGSSGDTKKSGIQSLQSDLTRGFDRLGLKFKQGLQIKRDSEDDVDKMSLRSGLSDDDEDFVLLGSDTMEDDVDSLAGFGRGRSDTASQDPDTASVTTMSSVQDKLRDMVSVSTINLMKIEAVFQSCGQDSVLKACVDHLLISSTGNVLLEEFQQSFTSGRKTLTKPSSHPIDAPFKLRLEMGPHAERLAPTAGERGFLLLNANGYHLNLAMSSLEGMVSLIEDEVIPPAMPMVIDVHNTTVTLEDDRPPVNITSPGAVPLDLNVDHVIISRTQDGVFHVRGVAPSTLGSENMGDIPSMPVNPTCPDISMQFLKATVSTLQRENKSLKEQLCLAQTKEEEKLKKMEENMKESLHKLNSENETLQKQLEKISSFSHSGISYDKKDVEELEEKESEMHVLKGERAQLLEQLVDKGEEIDSLKQERESLMKTLQHLQDELLRSEHQRVGK